MVKRCMRMGSTLIVGSLHALRRLYIALFCKVLKNTDYERNMPAGETLVIFKIIHKKRSRHAEIFFCGTKVCFYELFRGFYDKSRSLFNIFGTCIRNSRTAVFQNFLDFKSSAFEDFAVDIDFADSPFLDALRMSNV